MGSKRYAVIAATLLLVGLLPGRSAGEAGGTQGGRVVASYDAGLAGFSLGAFEVTAAFDGAAYRMTADGEFSLLAGLLYKASGKTTSDGKLTPQAPRPARFTLEFEDNKKHEERRLSFTRGTVSDVSIVPYKKPGRRTIPVTPAQLKNVLDPLTATFFSVRSDAPAGDPDVCAQTIPIFDGQQRFDLTLSPKRTETLGSAPRGLPQRAAVCRVRYTPIGGYRPNHPGVKFMTETDAIEVWLVPVARTGFYVPYKILVPTAWGDGTVTLTDLEVRVDERQRASAP